jgi:hypothetical protein
VPGIFAFRLFRQLLLLQKAFEPDNSSIPGTGELITEGGKDFLKTLSRLSPRIAKGNMALIRREADKIEKFMDISG